MLYGFCKTYLFIIYKTNYLVSVILELGAIIKTKLFNKIITKPKGIHTMCIKIFP